MPQISLYKKHKKWEQLLKKLQNENQFILEWLLVVAVKATIIYYYQPEYVWCLSSNIKIWWIWNVR